MISFFKKSHLQYDSVEEWIKSEKIPMPLTTIKDPQIFDRYLSQHAELRRHLFEKHLRSLSPDEEQLLKDHKHPSQSHAFAEAAQNYLETFRKEVPTSDCVEKIGLGNYHMDRLVIDVWLVSGTDVAEVRKYIPTFYRGFEVMLLAEKSQQSAA